MARSSVRLEGFGELQAQLTALQNCASPDEIEEIELEGAEIMADKVREKVPVRTGLLKRNVITKILRRYAWNRAAPAIVAMNEHPQLGAPHAHLIEFGTVKMAARPFFRPGVIESQDAAIARIQERIAEKIEQAAR